MTPTLDEHKLDRFHHHLPYCIVGPVNEVHSNFVLSWGRILHFLHFFKDLLTFCRWVQELVPFHSVYPSSQIFKPRHGLLYLVWFPLISVVRLLLEGLSDDGVPRLVRVASGSQSSQQPIHLSEPILLTGPGALVNNLLPPLVLPLPQASLHFSPRHPQLLPDGFSPLRYCCSIIFCYNSFISCIPFSY